MHAWHVAYRSISPFLLLYHINYIKQYSMTEEKNTIIMINNSVPQATQDKINQEILEEIETTIIFE